MNAFNPLQTFRSFGSASNRSSKVYVTVDADRLAELDQDWYDARTSNVITEVAIFGNAITFPFIGGAIYGAIYESNQMPYYPGLVCLGSAFSWIAYTSDWFKRSQITRTMAASAIALGTGAVMAYHYISHTSVGEVDKLTVAVLGSSFGSFCQHAFGMTALLLAPNVVNSFRKSVADVVITKKVGSLREVQASRMIVSVPEIEMRRSGAIRDNTNRLPYGTITHGCEFTFNYDARNPVDTSYSKTHYYRGDQSPLLPLDDRLFVSSRTSANFRGKPVKRLTKPAYLVTGANGAPWIELPKGTQLVPTIAIPELTDSNPQKLCIINRDGTIGPQGHLLPVAQLG